MIDTDLYVLPTIAHYLLDLPQGHSRASAFLSRTATLNNSNFNISYHDLLARNAAYILGRAVPFASSPQASNLLHLRPGQPVGNWRDSNQGLGYGQIPFDVNTALVPAALRALARLTQSGLLVLESQPDAGVQAARYADVWEAHATDLFNVEVNAATAESRWKDFVVRANLDDALLGSQVEGNVSFYALSLHDDGTPVDVIVFFFFFFIILIQGEPLMSVGPGDAQRPCFWSFVRLKHIQPTAAACCGASSTISQRLSCNSLLFPSLTSKQRSSYKHWDAHCQPRSVKQPHTNRRVKS
jgi:hypothetical protein